MAFKSSYTYSVPDSDYPHWDMKPELKRYYLMQAAYWVQQLLVLVFGLEKPRKDYYELVAHHLVTLWLVGCVIQFQNNAMDTELLPNRWSYLINLTRIGNAVYVSMDIPDTFLAVCTTTSFFVDTYSTALTQFSKILNYLQFERGKIASFAIFIPIWTYVTTPLRYILKLN